MWTWDVQFTDAQWKSNGASLVVWDSANWRWIVSEKDGGGPEPLMLDVTGTWYPEYSPTFARITYTYNNTPFSRELYIKDSTGHNIFCADPYTSYTILPLETGAEIYTIGVLEGPHCNGAVGSWLAITNIEFYVKIKK